MNLHERFLTKTELSSEETQHGLSALLKDGITSQIMGNLTGSTFVVALALELGASNFVIGLLAAIPLFAQIMQIPAIFVIEHVKNRRLVTVTISLVARFLWILTALFPFLPNKTYALFALIGTFTVNHLISAVSGVSWQSWTKDLVPSHQLGDFFAKRFKYSIAAGIATSLLVALFLDVWQKNLGAYQNIGYSILLILGCLVGWVGVYFLAQAPEPQLHVEENHFLEKILIPFKNKNFANLIKFSSVWNFGINFAVPFFSVYMLKSLGFPVSWVILLSILSELMSFLFIGIWGKFADKFNNKSILRVSCPLFLIAIFSWTFATFPEKHIFTLPLIVMIHILSGIASSGINLANGNIAYKLAPKNQATSYLAANNLSNAVIAGVAPVIGGVLADVFSYFKLSWAITFETPSRFVKFPTLEFEGLDFFFFFAFLIGLYALHKLSQVEESGSPVSRKFLLGQMARQFSEQIYSAYNSVNIKQITGFPFYSIEMLTGGRRK